MEAFMQILVVDDDKTTRRLLSLYLKKWGYKVVTAENGLDAMEKIGINDFDLILSDMNMPYMDGVEFTKGLKNNPIWCNIPVIMITTEMDEDDKKRAIEAGVDEYLVKPVNADLISDSIKRVLSSGGVE
ncbi:response regulator [Thermodesulfovibrionales bacterium]|nr:response regulator [Thermodesulfovibrionales bacterium]